MNYAFKKKLIWLTVKCTYDGEVGLYDGDVGLYDGDVGLYEGLVGLYL